jgi:hypothetical protein
MALITISGTVFAVGNEKTLNVWEIKKADNRDIFIKWTIWADQPWGVVKGDWVEVCGELGTKVGEYNGKAVVEHSLWQPTLVQHKPNTDTLITPATIDEDDRRKYGSDMAPF